MTMPGVGRKSIAGIVAALLIVDVLVASVLAMPGSAPWLVAGVLLTVLGALVLRAEYERQRIEWLERTQPVAAEDGPEPTGVVLARFLYYAGTAAIGILLLRFGGATVSDLLYLGSLGAVVAGLIAMNTNPSVLLPKGLIVGVLVFCAGGLITAFYAPSATDNLGVLFRVTYLVAIWFWLGTMVLTELRHVRTAMLWWVISAAIASAGAVAQTVFGDVIPGGTIHYGRVSGLTDHVNDLGGLAGVTVVPALALLYKNTGAGRTQRLTAAICLPLIGLGLILSGSISGVMAALVERLRLGRGHAHPGPRRSRCSGCCSPSPRRSPPRASAPTSSRRSSGSRCRPRRAARRTRRSGRASTPTRRRGSTSARTRSTASA